MRIENMVVTHHGRDIAGRLYFPENDNFPMVIFSHGFNGSGDNFLDYAGRLAEHGIGVCTFDFCGCSLHSKSGLVTTEMTVFTEKEDLFAVIDAVGRRQEVDSGRVFLFGESMGGLVSALAAEERSHEIKGMILLYPALCVADDWNEKFPDVDDIPDRYQIWEVPLGKCFFETLHGFDVFKNIGKYSGRVLFLHGDKDDIVPFAYSEKANAIYPHSSLRIFPGEGHGFSDNGRRQVIHRVIDFVREIQK